MSSSSSWLQRRVFAEFRPPAALRPFSSPLRDAPDGLRVTWLGTAGFVVQSATTTLMIDPYLSRVAPGALLTRPLCADMAAIARHTPCKLDAVICGHSHFDHLMDAPAIAQMSGAELIGSATTCAFGAAAGLAKEQMRCVPSDGAHLSVGDLTIRMAPSRHARLFCGHVPFAGFVHGAPTRPRFWHYRMGGAFGVFVGNGAVSLYHNGSADLVDVALRGEQVDAVLLGLAGWKTTPGYLPRLLSILRPRLVIPSHHDAFFAPLEAGVRLLPGVDFPRVLAELERIVPGARLIAPLYSETVCIPRVAEPYLLRRAGSN